MMFEPGEVFSRFNIERMLGEGGMGEVYLAEDTKLSRKVALKILQAEFFDKPDRLDRFVREAKTAAKVSHPHVMAIYDMDTDVHQRSGRQLRYIVMEYISGQLLTQFLPTKAPRLSELLRIAEKVASGLAAAHQHGIVHRDIKSDNIMIDPQGEPKILDFGLAKPIDTVISGEMGTDTVSRQLTQEGKILGTVTYMSPEQARGEAVDARSDIFSFGVLLYRMFTNEFPFEGRDRVSVLAKILETRQTPVRQKNESLPTELERIIDKCLQKDPNDRYQDTRDLVVDLRSLRRQFDSGISESVSITTEIPAARKAPRSLWPGWGAYAIAAVLLLVIAAAVVNQLGPSDEEEPATTLSDADLEQQFLEDPEAFAENLRESITRTLAEHGVPMLEGAVSIPGFSIKQDGLAVLGFENKTGDSTLNWLTAGLPEILLTDLAQTGATNLISRNRVLDCLRGEAGETPVSATHQKCVDAAGSLGATTVLSGAFYKLGDMIRIDARLEDVRTGQIVQGEKVVGDDPFVLVDSLTQKIAQYLDVKDKAAANEEVASITSSSPAAYKEYILGMEQFGLSLYEEAIEHFERAVAIDSGFALPYMRIGMSYAMRGRGQQGAPYFREALNRMNRLPIKDRTLIDIYADVWLRLEFDDAMVKMRSFVANYPDDKEARAVYAILLWALQQDSAGAFAQLDSVIMLDPYYPLALSWYTAIHTDLRNYEKAINWARLAKTIHPQSPDPYRTLSSLYFQLSRFEEAAQECHQMIERFPEISSPLFRLHYIFLQTRQFDSARHYIGIVKERFADDPYRMSSYWDAMANLSFWSGEFRRGLDYQHRAIEPAFQIGDSLRVTVRHNLLAFSFQHLGMVDSALLYAEKGYEWSTGFQSVSYPILAVSFDRGQVPQAESIFAEAIENFRSRVPQELWNLADALEDIFEGYCEADTSRIIAGYQSLANNPTQQDASDIRQLGQLLVRAGRYVEGLEVLGQILDGSVESDAAFDYLFVLYYSGLAHENLGNTQEAIAKYEELLKFWGDVDIPMPELDDAHERLRRLSS